ncbi:TetR/AcrR family transcriptional regulator [Tepidiforma sp.]|uniref:TetR/AcrR family transcriptional regulator n=1 Tax=Tepidiforma sp. TaxID=2682230 RepID=UPI002ADE6FCF|nr:TetR/AcrR family transcriptional regulator [Tepidiforma sp.]
MSLPERSDARLNRQRILEAAAGLFTEHGTAVEMRQIAEAAGVGVGTIYRNFPTKAELIVAIITDIVDTTEARLEQVLAIDDPLDAVRAFIATLFTSFDRIAPLAMELMATPHDQELHDRVMRWMAEPRLLPILQRGIERGQFRPELDPPVAVRFIASVASPITLVAGRGELSLDRLRDGFIDLVLRALRPQPPA